MSQIATSVPFFTDDIVIDVLCCTRDDHINRELSLREFGAGQALRLESLDNGELKCHRQDGAFIQGPEIS